MDIKQRITLTCRELAKTKGFHALTMDELAAASGVSKRTVYRYFRSKEEIIEWTLETFMQETAAFIDLLLTTNIEPAEMLGALL
ncbi:MAG: helix-turn-helix domain-containing protein [Bacillota bacterium]|nr:helix-turn-helix domain-containing protein [Bacillota bacterium]